MEQEPDILRNPEMIKAVEENNKAKEQGTKTWGINYKNKII
jgi:hypothetical protein